MKSKVLLLLTTLLTFSISNAQTVLSLSDFSREVGLIHQREAGQRAPDINGTPYLNDEFELGAVIVSDQLIYNGIPLRYNIFNDQIEFKSNKDLVLALDKAETYKEIQIEKKRFVYASATKGKLEVSGFFEILEEGQVCLLKKYDMALTAPQPPGGFKDAVPASYDLRPANYFLKIGDSNLGFSNEKELTALLQDHQKELESYIKNNKLKVRKEEDLLQMIKYYNSL